MAVFIVVADCLTKNFKLHIVTTILMSDWYSKIIIMIIIIEIFKN